MILKKTSLNQWITLFWNHRDIKIGTTDKRRSILASEPNYHSTKYISKGLLIMEMKKAEVRMNKPIYLGHAIPDLSKTLM